MRISIHPDSLRTLRIQLQQSLEEIHQISELLDQDIGSLELYPILCEEISNEWELARQLGEMTLSLLTEIDHKIQLKVDQLHTTDVEHQPDHDKYPHILSGFGIEYMVSSNPLSTLASMAGYHEEMIFSRYSGGGQSSCMLPHRTSSILHKAVALNSEVWTFADPVCTDTKQPSSEKAVVDELGPIVL